MIDWFVSPGYSYPVHVPLVRSDRRGRCRKGGHRVYLELAAVETDTVLVGMRNSWFLRKRIDCQSNRCPGALTLCPGKESVGDVVGVGSGCNIRRNKGSAGAQEVCKAGVAVP